MKRLLPLAPLPLLLLLTMGVGPCDSKPLGSVDGCTYNGKTYAAGAAFPAKDGCNSCSCQNGNAVCTLLGCQQDASLDATGDGATSTCFDVGGNPVPCPITDGGQGDVEFQNRDLGGAVTDPIGTCYDLNGKAYMIGASFPCGDGCNTCYCTSTGMTSTAIACADGGADGPAPSCYDTSGDPISCGFDGGIDCLYGNTFHPIGDSFPSSDGCNTCTCTSGQMVSCTQKACADAGIQCLYANKAYPIGSTFPNSDGCNTCTCGASGVIACTQKTCDGGVAADAAIEAPGPTCSDANGKPVSCPDGGVTSGCSYNGVTYAVGSKFTCSIDAGCNDGVCVCATPGTTVPLCGGEPIPVCGFDASYVYGQIGGLTPYTDQVTLTPPASYVLVRTVNPVGAGATGGSCGPALPACGGGPIDVNVIMQAISDPTVQLLLSLSTTQTTLLGVDERPVDGPIFSFKKAGTAGFLVGAPCNGAANCTDIPAAVTNLKDDLQKLDAQQAQDPSCAAFMKTM